MTETGFRELERLFLALGDKTRLRLLALMADREVAVGFLADRLGESQPKVSRHLAYLRNAGVVRTRRDGKWIYYGISYPRDAALRAILETVIRSIAVMRIDDEYVYFTEAEPETAEANSPEDNIYEETYMNRADDTPYDEYEEELEEFPDVRVAEDEEMDVFLL